MITNLRLLRQALAKVLGFRRLYVRADWIIVGAFEPLKITVEQQGEILVVQLVTPVQETHRIEIPQKHEFDFENNTRRCELQVKWELVGVVYRLHFTDHL